MKRLPRSVVMIAFATGSVTIQSVKAPAELRALLNEPDVQPDGTVTEITIESISETEVREDKRSPTIDYVLKNEEIHFRKKDVVFWSISEAVDPPKVVGVPQGLVKI